MNRPLLPSRLGLVLLSLTLLLPAAPAPSQDIIGEIIGETIGPAVGPILEAGGREVLNRAGGQLLEEALNRDRRRRIRPRPSPQPVPQPYPRPVPVPSPGPVVIDGGTAPPQEYRPQPAPVPPPANEVIAPVDLEPNLSPLDTALTRVLADGPALAEAVTRAEASGIARLLDEAALRGLQSPGSEPGVSLAASYRLATRERGAGESRQAWLDSHQPALQDQETGGAVSRLIEAAAAAAELSDLPAGATFDRRQQAIEALRGELSGVTAGPLLGGSDLAVTAERVRLLRNMSVITEMARVMGVERRADLFEQLGKAVEKSQMPTELLSLLTGFAAGDSNGSLPELALPPGSPPIALYNPLPNGATVQFVIDDEQEFSLAPGDIVTAVRPFILAFDTGKGETKRYTLSEGFFQWYIEDAGWEVHQKTKVRFTLDASESPIPFRYHLDGEPDVLPPGSSVTLESAMPPRFDFHRGLADGSASTKVLTPGRFVIGVDAASGGLDLFPAEEDEDRRVRSTTARLAIERWRASVASVLRPGGSTTPDPVDEVLGGLLESLE